MIIKYDYNKMKELLSNIYLLTNIKTAVFDSDFQEIAKVPGYDCAFCSLIRNDVNANKKCSDSDQYACEKSKEIDSPFLYICHAGLTEVVAPVHYGNIIIGYIIFGQLLQQNDTAAYWEEIKVKCSDYNVDYNELFSAYIELKKVTNEEIYATAQLLEVCVGYLRLQQYVSHHEDNLHLQVDEYISNNLDKDLSIEALCAYFNISRSKLCRVAKENYGRGITQVIRRLRVKKAKELLGTTVLPVSEIASSVGYPDYNYFIKIFKNSEGITPLKYRGKYKNQSQIDIDDIF